VTVDRCAFAPGADTRRLQRMGSGVIAPVLAACLGVGAVFSATLFWPGAPAGAGQISNLQAQAQQLAHEMLLEQLQVGGYQEQHNAAELQVLSDELLLTETQARITGLQQRISRDTGMLAHEAVTAYVENGTAADAADPLFGNQQTSAARTTYDRVVTGDLNVAIDVMRSDRQALAAQVVARRRIVGEDQAAVSQAATMLGKAQYTEQILQNQHASVTAQLSAALAQQQAAQAAAAAAAVAAAQAQAATQAAAAAQAQAAAQAHAAQTPSVQPTSGSAPPGGATPGTPTLNPFLQCVVQAESGGDYQAVSPTGQYMGAFQFSQPTWNEAAGLAGMPSLVGVAPNTASPADQDALAIALYAADGQQPWYDPCRTG